MDKNNNGGKPQLKNKVDRRHTSHKVEIREVGEGDEAKSRTIRGYAAKFGVESGLIGWDWVEVIKKGAFDDVLENDVRCLKNHDRNLVLGRTKAGTLTLGVDEIGLWYECVVVRNTAGDDLLADIRHGNIDQSSFGFMTLNFDENHVVWRKVVTEDNAIKWVREVHKVTDLLDVSPVTFPAYDDTEVAELTERSFKAAVAADVVPPSTSTAKAKRDRDLYLLSLDI